MILLIDNYDSFTYNLAQYLSPYAEIEVARNDQENVKDLAEKAEAIVFSPGPGRPADAGEMERLIERYALEKPLLGICLGHQAIGEVFGGNVILAERIRHGKVSQMQIIQQDELFAELPETLTIMRYHSLIVEQKSFPTSFEVLGLSTDDQEIMAMKHKKYPVYGLQFHPESIGTESGQKMMENFCKIVRRFKSLSEGVIRL